MRILAIETSGTAGSVATLDAGRLLAQLELDPAERSTRTLAPAIAQALERTAWKPTDVQLVAVARGPGSFTSLRLGVMTAKAFAYAVGAKILGIGTLDAIAARAPLEARELAVAVDAQRGELYGGSFVRSTEGMIAISPVEIVADERWLSTLRPGMTVSGPALTKLAHRVHDVASVAPSELWFPDAGAVGLLAAARHALGAVDDVWTLSPFYVRRSAAEEKWESRTV